MHWEGLEPPTLWFEARYSIRLSYQCKKKVKLWHDGTKLERIKSINSQEFSTQGIVVKSFPYNDKQTILNLFTDQFGLISLFVPSKKGVQTFPPFFEAEWVLHRKKSSFFKLIDYKQTHNHLLIRSSLEKIETAALMTSTILKSQLHEKSSPLLYSLFALYLKKLPHTTNLDALLTSFITKLLKHEGLLRPSDDPLSKLSSIKTFEELEKTTITQEQKELALALFEHHYHSEY